MFAGFGCFCFCFCQNVHIMKCTSLFLILVYSITVVATFPPLLSSVQPTPPPTPKSIPRLLSMSMGYSYMFFDQSLPLLSTPIPFPTPPGSCQSVSCFHACGSVLFISLFCHQIPLIGEIIWYLSFTIWFTSLSMILSRSIHAIAKGRSSFFLSLHSLSLIHI